MKKTTKKINKSTVITVATGIRKSNSTGKYYVKAGTTYLGTYSSLIAAKTARKNFLTPIW